jgi:hypothetical protein
MPVQSRVGLTQNGRAESTAPPRAIGVLQRRCLPEGVATVALNLKTSPRLAPRAVRILSARGRDARKPSSDRDGDAGGRRAVPNAVSRNGCQHVLAGVDALCVPLDLPWGVVRRADQRVFDVEGH